jgi:hypothetical protein
LVGGRSEQGTGCRCDIEPLKEALASGGTAKQSSSEVRRAAERGMERRESGEGRPLTFASQ